jgi:DNA-directed RNA polymerase subunit M/transcription elongation factor TFIIS
MIKCPKCNSSEVYANWKTKVMNTLFDLPKNTVYECKKCGEIW